MKRGSELRKEFTETSGMYWKDYIKQYTIWLEYKILEMEKVELKQCNKKPKDFLEKLGLTDSDYQDSGMINHISDLLERYHTEQLNLSGVDITLTERIITPEKHSLNKKGNRIRIEKPPFN
jgi:hypothetical protein